MKKIEVITDLIGNTPLLHLNRIFPGNSIYGKCEFMNPFSLKDRPILQIFNDAENLKLNFKFSWKKFSLIDRTVLKL